MVQSVPVLMYHSISDRATPAFRRWTVSPGLFAAHMQYLADSGFASLRAGDYAACLSGDVPLPAKPVVITFDDGYADFAGAALPIMRTHALTSTLFVTSGYVGGSSKWLVRQGETGRPMLTWDDLAAMDDDVEVGGHGYSHRQLDLLPHEQALADITQGRTLLSERVGRPICSFAYPHGYSTPALRRALRAAGFTSAHGVVHAMSSLDDDPFSVSRLIVDDQTDLETFASLLAGQEVPTHPQPGWQQNVWRWWRRGRLALGLDRHHLPA